MTQTIGSRQKIIKKQKNCFLLNFTSLSFPAVSIIPSFSIFDFKMRPCLSILGHSRPCYTCVLISRSHLEFGRLLGLLIHFQYHIVVQRLSVLLAKCSAHFHFRDLILRITSCCLGFQSNAFQIFVNSSSAPEVVENSGVSGFPKKFANPLFSKRSCYSSSMYGIVLLH